MGRPSLDSRVTSSETLPLLGVSLVLVATAGGALLAGPAGALAAGLFGLLAAGIQLVSRRLMRGIQGATLPQFLKRWGTGMGLRLLGVVLVGIVIWLEPPALPPLPAALAYIGVLIPLLFLEARRI